MCGEAEEVAGVGVNTQLPETLVQVTGAHIFDAGEFVKNICDVGKGVAVARNAAVGDAEVVTVAHGAIRFRDLSHWRGPGSAARFDDAEVKHSFDTFAL